jgi:aldose 1-epimerase
MTTINKQHWGDTSAGEAVYLFTMRNANGMEVSITNFGGRIVTLKTADKQGKFEDLVLGFDTLAPYLEKNPFFGALAGRYANRIANGEFTLDGHTYHLLKNNGPNSLHGGALGFDKKVWTAQQVDDGVQLTYVSKDGEEGYPGKLTSTVTYTLGADNALKLAYHAVTDKDTVLNLTNHCYFNLAGHANGNILDHVVTIHASRITPVNANLIPTGELAPVQGTPFDFLTPHRIGDRIDSKDQQMQYGTGYDHNFVLDKSGAPPSLAAHILEPKTGRIMEVLTTQPGVQFYTGNHLPEKTIGKGGAVYGFRAGICFETQHFPDSPNHPSFPTSELKPGQQYNQTTIFRFSHA